MPAKVTSTAVGGQKMPPKLRLKLANECTNIADKAKMNPLDKTFHYWLVHSKDVNDIVYGRLMILFESLMRDMYENSSWGWDEKDKLSEWRHAKTRILIVTKSNMCDPSPGKINYNQLPDSDDELVAFMCFRFETGADKGECAFYVYELHVSSEHQRQGLGQDLMRLARIMATAFKMDKIMLTVFRSNQPALQFYKKLNFIPDKTSPASNEADYIILSSKIK